LGGAARKDRQAALRPHEGLTSSEEDVSWAAVGNLILQALRQVPVDVSVVEMEE
jgi:hypothetical protein